MELGLLNEEQPTIIVGDNKGAIALTQNPQFHKRTKHIVTSGFAVASECDHVTPVQILCQPLAPSSSLTSCCHHQILFTLTAFTSVLPTCHRRTSKPSPISPQITQHRRPMLAKVRCLEPSPSSPIHRLTFQWTTSLFSNLGLCPVRSIIPSLS